MAFDTKVKSHDLIFLVTCVLQRQSSVKKHNLASMTMWTKRNGLGTKLSKKTEQIFCPFSEEERNCVTLVDRGRNEWRDRLKACVLAKREHRM